MTAITTQLRRVLSIFPHSKGFGFVVFEHVSRPLDWGVKRLRAGNQVALLSKLHALVDTYRPDVILMEPPDTTRRSARITEIAVSAARYAEGRGIELVFIGRIVVRAHFMSLGAATKHATAGEIARLVPALAPHLPPPRKPWQSEDARMAVFVAFALALCWSADGEPFEVPNHDYR